MIKKYNQYIKESLLDKLEGPSDDELLDSFTKMDPLKVLYLSINKKIPFGIRYANKKLNILKYVNADKINDLARESAIKGEYDMLDALLDAGASVNYFSGDLLVKAVFNNDINSVKVLLKHKINPNILYRDVLNKSKEIGNEEMYKLLHDYISNYNKEHRFLKESLLDKLKGPSKEEVWSSLGYDRTFDTPEEFLLYLIKDIKIRPQTKKRAFVFWEKDGEIIFQQDLKNKVLWVKHNTIWKIFENIFNMKYIEIQGLIKNIVEEHLNWKGFTPLIKF